MSDRETRRQIAAEAELSPNSLCGSYFLHDTGYGVEQGIVVAEVQPGTYVLEFMDLVTDETLQQRLVKLDAMLSEDWSFCDSHAAVLHGLRRMMQERVD